jgi:hypothetical protein
MNLKRMFHCRWMVTHKQKGLLASKLSPLSPRRSSLCVCVCVCVRARARVLDSVTLCHDVFPPYVSRLPLPKLSGQHVIFTACFTACFMACFTVCFTVCLCISPNFDGYKGTKNETLTPEDPKRVSVELFRYVSVLLFRGMGRPRFCITFRASEL